MVKKPATSAQLNQGKSEQPLHVKKINFPLFKETPRQYLFIIMYLAQEEEQEDGESDTEVDSQEAEAMEKR